MYGIRVVPSLDIVPVKLSHVDLMCVCLFMSGGFVCMSDGAWTFLCVRGVPSLDLVWGYGFFFPGHEFSHFWWLFISLHVLCLYELFPRE